MKRMFLIASNVPFFFDGVSIFTQGNAIDYAYDDLAFNTATRNAVEKGLLTKSLHVNPEFKDNDLSAREVLNKYRKWVNPAFRVPLLRLPGFEDAISNVPYWDYGANQLIAATQN